MSYSNLKLGDFGWSAYIEGKRQTFCGTLEYVSPEVIKGEKYDYNVDLWSIGVLTYELLTGYAPFDATNKQEAYQNIVSLNYEIPKYISKEGK